MSWHLLGGVYLGWSLGANNAANVFGTAVASRVLRFGTATVLCGIFVLIGALSEGRSGIETIGGLMRQTVDSATYSALGAAAAMTLMTFLRIPASTSQALVGSIIGIGLFTHGLNLTALPKVIICWLGTPCGAAIVALILYRVLGVALNQAKMTLFEQDVVLRGALIVVGCYAAYALGANNVANVTAVYYAAGMLSPVSAALVGGLSIALGAITFSRPLMIAVGRSIVRLDAFSAFVVVLAEAIVVHTYAWVGVPVSTSQAVVGAVIGAGIAKQASAIRRVAIVRILLGWLATPLIAALVSMLLFFVGHLVYLPHQ